MKELIEKLQAEAGVTAEQAEKALHSVKNYVAEKFPMIKGAVENIFQGGDATAAPAADESQSWMDKISDVIPGDIGEKIESFAKKAAEEGGEAFDKASDYAKDMYEKGKKKLDDLA